MWVVVNRRNKNLSTRYRKAPENMTISGMETLFDPANRFLTPTNMDRKYGSSVWAKNSFPGINRLYGRSDVSRNRITKAPANA
jgi:hypothetical protein